MSNGNGNGKGTTCKEVCTSCKCTVIEKPIKKKEEKKENCVATIVGVLQLPDDFCCPQKKEEPKEKKVEERREEECIDVYRDLGECLQKCIIQINSVGKKNGNGDGLECDIGSCNGNGNGTSKSSYNSY